MLATYVCICIFFIKQQVGTPVDIGDILFAKIEDAPKPAEEEQKKGESKKGEQKKQK